MTWNPNFIRTNAELDPEVKALVKYMNDPDSYQSSVMDGFTFDNQATPELVTAYAAVTRCTKRVYPSSDAWHLR